MILKSHLISRSRPPLRPAALRVLPPRRKESTARELLMESIRFARGDENCPKYFTQRIDKIIAAVPKPDRALDLQQGRGGAGGKRLEELLEEEEEE